MPNSGKQYRAAEHDALFLSCYLPTTIAVGTLAIALSLYKGLARLPTLGSQQKSPLTITEPDHEHSGIEAKLLVSHLPHNRLR